MDEVSNKLKKTLIKHLQELQKYNTSTLVLKRYKKFRKMGRFIEGTEKKIDNE